jgi:hypothetical protein
MLLVIQMIVQQTKYHQQQRVITVVVQVLLRVVMKILTDLVICSLIINVINLMFSQLTISLVSRFNHYNNYV